MRGSGYHEKNTPNWRPKTPFERDVRTIDLRLRRLERQNAKPRNEENEVTEVVRDRDKIIEEKYSKESLILFSCLCSLLTLVVVGFIAVILVILWRTSSLPFFRSDYFPPETHLHNRGLAIDSGIAFSSNHMDSKKIIPIRRIGNDPESGPGLTGISEWTLRKMNLVGREKNFLKENEQFQFSEESSIAIVFKIVYTRIGEDINLSDFQQANEEGVKHIFIVGLHPTNNIPPSSHLGSSRIPDYVHKTVFSISYSYEGDRECTNNDEQIEKLVYAILSAH